VSPGVVELSGRSRMVDSGNVEPSGWECPVVGVCGVGRRDRRPMRTI